jgi:hypothetical protein
MTTNPKPGSIRDRMRRTGSPAERQQVHKKQVAALLAQIAEDGGRTTTCPCGYGPTDSCPTHD